MTNDIYGQNSTVSSLSASLQSSLESKLHKKLEQLGSTMYRLTWRQKTTPAGWSYSQLVASAHPISVSDFIGSQTHWATPRTTDGSVGPRPITIKDGKAVRVSKKTGQTFGINLADQSKLTQWSTPVTMDKKSSCRTTTNKQTWKEGDTRHTNLDLAKLSSWPTPVAKPANGTPEQFLERKIQAVKNGSKMGITISDINMVAKLTNWPSPTTRDYKDTGDLSKWGERKDGKSRLDTVPRVATMSTEIRLTASGEMVIGYIAEMKNGGSLNPQHSRWLMGLPVEWESCADMATQSLALKRKRSSKATSKQK